MKSSCAAPKTSTEAPLNVRLLRSTLQLDPDRLEELYDAPCEDGMTFEERIIRSGLADERQIAQAYSSHYLMPLFDPPEDTAPPVDPAVAQILPRRLCRQHLIAPLSDDGATLEVAVCSPDALSLTDEIRRQTQRQMRPLFTTLSVVERLLSMLYDDGSWTSTADNAGSLRPQSTVVARDALDAGDADVQKIDHDQTPHAGHVRHAIDYLNNVLRQALQVGASDIHIEPYEHHCRVRLRVDGVLSEVDPPPMQILDSVVRRCKVLSNMDRCESGLPQESAVTLRSGELCVELRVNTCPTVCGEKVVIRVLDQSAVSHDVDSLGLDERQLEDLSEVIRSPHGMMLVSGPAGSGKTTTLYSCLKYLNHNARNICTVEDAVELKCAGINQVQTRPQDGLTFAIALRLLLRQDPDVMMVGEVRDQPTADICIRAALAGRFLLAALHTNDALSCITRLQDLGVEPFLLASTIRLLVAQRLLRRLCDECKIAEQVDPESAKRYRINPQAVVFRPGRCRRCRETGYRGRLAVFEIIRVNHKMQELIRAGENVAALQRVAADDGMQTLRQSAITRVVEGDTSLAEAISS